MPDPNFRSFHCLYSRCNSEDVQGDRLLAARIRIANPSVSWSKYAKPWDVIFDHPGWGIAQILAGALPKDLPKEVREDINPKDRPQPHSFKPAHQPLQDDYPHSEIWTYRGGEHWPDPRNMKPGVKKEYRQIISDRTVILHRPSK